MNAAEISRRLASIEALVRYAHVGVQLKRGDSAKLMRADEDLEQALQSLQDLRASVCDDKKANAMACMGELAASKYLRQARKGA